MTGGREAISIRRWVSILCIYHEWDTTSLELEVNFFAARAFLSAEVLLLLGANNAVIFVCSLLMFTSNAFQLFIHLDVVSSIRLLMIMVDGVFFLSPHQNIACNRIPSTLRHDMVCTVSHAVGATHTHTACDAIRINANELRLWTQCDGMAAWPKRNEFGLAEKTWKMFCSRYSNSRVWWLKGDGSIEHVRPFCRMNIFFVSRIHVTLHRCTATVCDLRRLHFALLPLINSIRYVDIYDPIHNNFSWVQNTVANGK